MKLLLFSDLHRNRDAATRLVTLSHAVDVVVGAGDFANAHRGIRDCIDILKAIDRPTILVPGNNETFDELVEASSDWPTARVLHGTAHTIKGLPFFGLGGGIPPTPFGEWSFDFTEEEAANMLTNCPASAVLVSHSPPKGAVDVSSSGLSLGSTAVRAAIASKKLRLIVCGHIHDSGGQTARIENTPVINAGPDGIMFDLPAVS